MGARIPHYTFAYRPNSHKQGLEVRCELIFPFTPIHWAFGHVTRPDE